MQPRQILSKSRKSKEVVAGSLLCFRAARELGLSLTELARQMEMTVAGIGYAVHRGAKVARENHYRLLKEES
jgi:plasmid maintenance system antidote protein VapI